MSHEFRDCFFIFQTIFPFELSFIDHRPCRNYVKHQPVEMNYLFSSPSKNSVAKRLLRPHWLLLRTRSCYRGERRTLSSTDSICMQVVSRLHTTNSNYDEPQHRQRQFYSSSSKTTTTISNNNDIPLMERSKKNFLQKMLNKYSVSEQTTRILLAESFFQAAVHQANNP